MSNEQITAVSPSIEHHAFTSLIQLREGQGGNIETYSNIFLYIILLKKCQRWLIAAVFHHDIYIHLTWTPVFVKVYLSWPESLFWWFTTWLDKKIKSWDATWTRKWKTCNLSVFIPCFQYQFFSCVSILLKWWEGNIKKNKTIFVIWFNLFHWISIFIVHIKSIVIPFKQVGYIGQ